MLPTHSSHLSKIYSKHTTKPCSYFLILLPSPLFLISFFLLLLLLLLLAFYFQFIIFSNVLGSHGPAYSLTTTKNLAGVRTLKSPIPCDSVMLRCSPCCPSLSFSPTFSISILPTARLVTRMTILTPRLATKKL